MEFNSLQNIALESLLKSNSLGFDELSICARQEKGYQIRVALGAVCRENIYFETHTFILKGSWQKRTFIESVSANNSAEILEALANARKDLESRSANLEWVPENPPQSSLSWDTTAGDFDIVFDLTSLYSSIEKNVAPYRNKGRRVSGFVKSIECVSQIFNKNDFKLMTRGHSIEGKFTVDNANGVETGSGQFSVPRPTPASFHNAIEKALNEANWVCEIGANPKELNAGDYTILFSPKALQALLSPLFWYGVFDKRKIDEGHTFLSNKQYEIQFPKGLHLLQSNQTNSLSGTFVDVPVLQSGQFLSDLNIIQNGQISETQCTPFWAHKNGVSQTFNSLNSGTFTLKSQETKDLKTFSDLNSMIANTEKGLFVAGLWYIRMVAEMDCVFTGMTRDGLFEIKNGKIVGAVKNMRWHQNILNVLSNTDAIGNESQLFGSSRAAGGGGLISLPALRSHNFHFSSVTKF